MRLGVGFEPNGQTKDDANNAHDQQGYYQIQVHIFSHQHAVPDNGYLHPRILPRVSTQKHDIWFPEFGGTLGRSLCCASRISRAAWAKADIVAALHEVHFTPKSGHELEFPRLLFP
jgi:hypothetical protein